MGRLRATHLVGLVPLALLAWNVTDARASAQTFEVASMKATDPSYVGPVVTNGGPGTRDPERVVYKATFLSLLLLEAYDVKRYQVIGPGWMHVQRYDIEAKVPAGTTQEEYRLMLRSLLKERLALSVHWERREKTVFELVAGKAPPKLRVDHNSDHSIFNIPSAAGRRAECKAVPISRLIEMLQNELGTRITDSTGLTESYSFTISYWFSDRPPSPDVAAFPSLPVALKDELGLELRSARGAVEYLVIDHAQRQPAAN